MVIDLIYKKYNGQIKLNNPIVCKDNSIPESLREILLKTNGIQETMIHPKTGEPMEIGWIVYSYDEIGKRVRTKKEITGEDGKIRDGCTVIKKGEAYESHLFTVKDDTFKNELFLEETKHFYTALINRHIQDPERRLKVFDPNSVYLPTKKIGKNNPKAAAADPPSQSRL